MHSHWASIIHRHLSHIIHTKITNCNLDPITITEVELSRDNKFAKVYFHCSGNIQRNEELLKKLTPKIKHLLGQAVELHHLPNLTFIYDNGLDNADHIDKLLQNLNKPTNN